MVDGPARERRQLTVLFCDIAGSTVLAEKLDAEDYLEVIEVYRSTCNNVAARYEGHRAQYEGDAILYYFGYPEAHEDDAQRAVRAGLEIMAAVRALRLRDNQLSLRVGIHTGLVVVGAPGSEGLDLALGSAVNIARRVQQAATSNTVVASESTHRLVRGYFTFEDSGEHELKGLAEKLHLYRVLEPSGARNRLDAARAIGLTPFVGRRDQLLLLSEWWGAARRGDHRVVSVCGEAGIGKSRLLEMLKARVVGDGYDVLECRCSPYYRNSALYPVIDLIERHLGFARDTSPEERLARVEASLGQVRLPSADVVPLIASLLSLPIHDKKLFADLLPQRRRQRTLEILAAWLSRLAERRPVLFIVEDLHWADPTTLEFAQLVMQKRAPYLMTFLTSRPDFKKEWEDVPVILNLLLEGLPETDVAQMITNVAGKPVPQEVVAKVMRQSERIPLFVEEVTKAILETGALRTAGDHYELSGSIPAGLIPGTVKDSLTARLDRLGPETKALAQLAATLGRDFRYELLAAVAGKEDTALQRDLDRLLDAALIFRYGETEKTTYSFKHALLRDAAYDSLLRKTRQQYHGLIAATLTEKFPDIVNTQPEMVASHYEEAALIKEAIGYWKVAGDQATGRVANREAIAHFQRAIGLLESSPLDPAQRSDTELGLQLGLMPSLMAIKGWASPEVEAACTRARDLAVQLNDHNRLLPALWGIWTMHFLRGDLNAALLAAEQVGKMAFATDNSMLHVLGHHAVGFTRFFRGEFMEALKHADDGIAAFDSTQEQKIVAFFQFSSTVALKAFRAGALWCMGHQATADEAMDDAMTMARDLQHLPSLAFAYSFRVYLNFYQGEATRTWEVADRMLTLSRDEGFLLWIAVATMYRGWAHAARGSLEEGIAEMKDGLDRFRKTGTSLTMVQLLAALSEMLWRAKRRDEALSTIDDGIAQARARHEHLFEPELHRLKGEILLEQAEGTGTEAAEASLREALQIARTQNAKALEQRIVTTLARLLQSEGRVAEARALNDDITAWLAENASTTNPPQSRAS